MCLPEGLEGGDCRQTPQHLQHHSRGCHNTISKPLTDALMALAMQPGAEYLVLDFTSIYQLGSCTDQLPGVKGARRGQQPSSLCNNRQNTGTDRASVCAPPPLHTDAYTPPLHTYIYTHIPTPSYTHIDTHTHMHVCKVMPTLAFPYPSPTAHPRSIGLQRKLSAVILPGERGGSTFVLEQASPHHRAVRRLLASSWVPPQRQQKESGQVTWPYNSIIL